MSHFQALVGITHTRPTASASAPSGRRTHSYSPHTIITERMFPSRVISISKRRQPSVSLMTPSPSLKIAVAPYAHTQAHLDSLHPRTPQSHSQPPSQGHPQTRPRRIVRRKLAAQIFGANLSIPPPETDDDDAQLTPELEGSSDESDDVTLVGGELLCPKVKPVSLSVPAAAGGSVVVVKPSLIECASPPSNRISRKIIQHITSFDSPENSDIEEAGGETSSEADADADAEDGSPTSTSRSASTSQKIWSSAHPDKLEHLNEDPEEESEPSFDAPYAYDMEVEERSIVCHTALCPPPWYRRARQIHD